MRWWPPCGWATGPSAVAVGPDGVWAASEVRGTVSRLDPDTNTVAATIQVGSAPAGAAVVGDDLWVTTRGTPSSHRGGTLRLTSASYDTPDRSSLSGDTRRLAAADSAPDQ